MGKLVLLQGKQITRMFDAFLHLGIEHPSFLWVFIASLLAFVMGLGLGIRSNRFKEWLSSRNGEATN